MADVKWIKIAVNIFDNRKIRQIECLPDGDGVIAIWFKILCLAGTVNDCGMIYMTKDIPYTEQMLAVEFNRPIALIQMAMRVFQQFSMIEIVDEIIHVSNWERYQNIEAMERIRGQTRQRVAAHRERKALNEACNVTVTQCNATDKEEDIDKIKKESIYRRFTPPTITEVSEYCKERNNTVDPQRFIDHYTSNGWMVGKVKMKDWKATVRNWEKKDAEYNRSTQKPGTSVQASDRPRFDFTKPRPKV